ncbi:MAG: cobaltochelatase subunit CobN [Pseudomonadota bacterium]|jgi:cobaltochelatase CobN
MHILVTQGQSLDAFGQPVDLDQSPGDLVVLSFTDSDLSGFAAAADLAFGGLADTAPSVRLASLAQLRHPMSADLYIEKVIAHARFVLVRLLGGLDYWRYGAEQIFAVAKRQGIPLAIVPGDTTPDARLASVSTLTPETLDLFARYCTEGGIANLSNALRQAAVLAGMAAEVAPPCALPRYGVYRPGEGVTAFDAMPAVMGVDKPVAAIIFYRALLLAGDLAPIDTLHAALAVRGMQPVALFAASLKEPEAANFIQQSLATFRPTVIVNTTAFSAKAAPQAPSPLDAPGVPVFQAVLAGSSREAWIAAHRGLSAADLAMNVVLPELDGRLLTGSISFKRAAGHRTDLQFTRHVHEPDAAGVAHTADVAAAWARLAACPRADKRLAILLPDYPGKSGRAGSGVGLDGPASAASILNLLRAQGYAITKAPKGDEIFRHLTNGQSMPFMDAVTYQRLLERLPQSVIARVTAAWGLPSEDASCVDGLFHHHIMELGSVVLSIQPDRAARIGRKDSYHDPALPPRHAYIAFHLWLRYIREVHAIVMLGAHGTLEWLPGKAVALSQTCFPRAIIGSVPVIYPFIVSNPGEAAQAKRRLGAVTIGHMTPPLVTAGLYGAAAGIEPLIDEFAEAQGLDPRRATGLADEILSQASVSGLAAECGIAADMDRIAAVAKIDAWLCEIKEMRIRDGQHIFGATIQAQADDGTSPAMRDTCAKAEQDALICALDGRFVLPGPGGAPSRGRRDVLPTGRNLYAVDPRAVPTRTAMALGHRAAAEFIRVHLQQHGDWPRHVVMDLWASTAMRTGGEDLAQALALLGVRPTWDHASTRVTGYEILPLAKMQWPRIDVTLRISGLFRDVFPAQIDFFDAAISAVAKLDEPDESNYLAMASRRRGQDGPRIFGPAPGAYGSGIERTLAEGTWRKREELANSYLAASSYAYGRNCDGQAGKAALNSRLASVDAVIHVADMAEADMLDTGTVPNHIGGLAAAIAATGNRPAALYESNTSDPERPQVQDYQTVVARTVRGRAGNPHWIAGQMRHGPSGAAVMADTLDALFAFAATTGADCEVQFSLLFDAFLGDQKVADFLRTANPAALHAIAARFSEAIRRELWRPRRNSAAMRLAQFAGAPP